MGLVDIGNPSPSRHPCLESGNGNNAVMGSWHPHHGISEGNIVAMDFPSAGDYMFVSIGGFMAAASGPVGSIGSFTAAESGPVGYPPVGSPNYLPNYVPWHTSYDQMAMGNRFGSFSSMPLPRDHLDFGRFTLSSIFGLGLSPQSLHLHVLSLKALKGNTTKNG